MVLPTLLARRCISSTITRRCAGALSSLQINSSSSAVKFSAPPITFRSFSSVSPPPPPTATPQTNTTFTPQSPTSLSPDAGLAAQDAMKLFIQHGIGKQKLSQIAADMTNKPLVDRWQAMIQTYLETQCHVISLLGYTPNEHGIALYTQHLSSALASSSPEIQETLRVAGRDTYRMVLSGAFDIPDLLGSEQSDELSIVDARNIMHKVSLRMQGADVLEKVAKQCSTSVAMNDSPEAKQIDLAHKHTVVQQIMVTDVYLKVDEISGKSLVEECGFREGEEGYIRMQSVLAEHQGDPLINQYVGAAMMKLLQCAGIDMGELQKQAQQAQQQQVS